MNRQIASRQRKVMSQPPEPPRGPVQSIASAQNFANLQQQQQQQLKQRQYQSQQPQPQPPQLQSQRRPNEPQTKTQRLPNGLPSQVTVPQAISIIVSRLNNIESRVMNSSGFANQGNQGDEQIVENNELDHAIAQLYERVQELETNHLKTTSQHNDYLAKINKLENDLRDSKDMIIKLQSFSIDTTNKLLSFGNNSFVNPSLGSSINSSTNSIVSLDEPITVVIKEIIQNELVDSSENVENS